MLSPRWIVAFLVLASSPALQAGETPKRATPLNLTGLNTDKDEDDPFLVSNGLQLYYTSNAAEGGFTLWSSTRKKVGGAWPAGQRVDGYFPEKAEVRSPWLTAEGKYPQFLYCAAKDPKAKNFDLFALSRDEAGYAFSTLRGVNPLGTAADEMHPWLSADGKQLYFSRLTADGWRMLVSPRKTATGVQGWDEPKLLDLPPGYHHATFDPTGKTMYLQGPLDNKRWGLFVSTATKNGWSKPEPLPELNDVKAPTGDRSPSLNREGTLLYFVSDRAGGKGGLDIWAIPRKDLHK